MPDNKSKFLRFDLRGKSESGKTLCWHVYGSENHWLGSIGWFAPWRKYTFETVSMTVLDAACLRDIADFCEQATEEHKQKVKGSAA